MAERATFSWRAVVLSAVLGGGLGYLMFARTQSPPATPREVTTRSALYMDEQQTVDLFKNAAPSVVYINVVRQARGNVIRGTGSGFVWDNDGHIVTNLHVVGDADTAEVHDNEGNKYTAEVIGIAPEADIAVLKINPKKDLRPIPLGTSADLQVGQKVYAIGTPFGLDRTLTTGIVSAVGRALSLPTAGRQTIENAIQTDAAINPGNSGGPLLDSAGRLIGVNAAINSSTGANVGIGFAVPVDTVNRIVPSLIQTGHARASLGLVFNDGASQMAYTQFGVIGAAVTGIVPSSVAAAAGFAPWYQDEFGNIISGDVVTKIENQPVRSAAEVDHLLKTYTPGQEITIEFWRNGQIGTKKVRLDSAMKVHR